MSDHEDKTLKAAFEKKERAADCDQARVPEAIKRHNAAPALRPGGSWRALADQSDRKAREQEQANRSKNNWSKKLNNSLRYGKGFNREA